VARVALLIPTQLGRLEKVATCDEVTLRVARDLIWKPRCVRFAADHDDGIAVAPERIHRLLAVEAPARS
jgi:hypothetical protein